MKISKVYTRTGDSGLTSLVGGQRVSKASVRLEAYGTIDELSSHIGLLVAMLNNAPHSLLAPRTPTLASLERIQNNLFYVGTQLATELKADEPIPDYAQLPEGETAWLEQLIDEFTATLPPLSGFILPGGTVASAQAHVCRTVCRRAERVITSLADTAVVGSDVRQYVNRLSDYLFVLARMLNIQEGKEEILWKKLGNKK
jgi:cob(I)alamin adenosyltransferase